MARVVMRPGAFESLKAPGGAIDRAVAKGAGKGRDTAKELAPVGTGRLRESIRSERIPDPVGVTYRVGTNVDYAEFQEGGTGIYGPTGHPIYPRRAKALRWVPKNGPYAFVFARSVRGAPAKHFLRRAMERLRLVDFI